MKTKKVIFYGLMFLPLAVVLISLPFLPDQIPAHYNLSNQVDRWGSKYEMLILPASIILFGCFMLGMAKLTAGLEKGGSISESVCMIAGIATLILFNAMTGYFLYAAFHKIENLSSIAFDMNQLSFGFLGFLMIVVGIVIAKFHYK